MDKQAVRNKLVKSLVKEMTHRAKHLEINESIKRLKIRGFLKYEAKNVENI